MLSSLNIKNVALLEELNIEFSNGLNVLLGETGAGKSIIFDSLEFVLGGKADKSFIRYGANSMQVEAIFSNVGDKVKASLEEYDIEVSDEIIIKRSLSIDGKQINKINGISVVASMIKNIASELYDSYGQHESSSLLKSNSHILILDNFSKQIYSSIKHDLENSFLSLQEINKKINSLGGDDESRERTLDLLKYQIDEIESANLELGEYEEISSRLQELNNSEKIITSINGTLENLDNSGASVINMLTNAISELSSISFIDSASELYERLKSSQIEIEDIIETLDELKSNVVFDEKEFNNLDQRLDKIKSLNKKYGGSIEECLKYLDKIKEEYDNLLNGAERLEEYKKERERVYNHTYSIAKNLSDFRKKQAKIIEEKIVIGLKELGMKNARFIIDFKEIPLTSNGIDNIEFLFSANLGQELKPLSKVASGGELSRFMLVFKNILADNDKIDTLIFDEIDSGISGEIGFKVAEKLAILSKRYQILCITHLPQVAASADTYFKVYKETKDGNTYTHAIELNGDDIYLQIAFLAGGDSNSLKAFEHAKDLKDKFNNFKAKGE